MLRNGGSYRLLLVLQRDGTEEDLGAPQLLGVHFDQSVFGRFHVHTGGLHGRPIHRCGGLRSPRLTPGPVFGIVVGILEVQVPLEPVGFKDLALRVVWRGRLWRHLPAEAQVVFQPLGHHSSASKGAGVCGGERAAGCRGQTGTDMVVMA